MSRMVVSNMSEAPDKPEDQPSGQPQPDEEVPSQHGEVPEDELRQVFEAHKIWRWSEGKEGEQADLRRANLEGAYLCMANLQEANLKGANLQGANLWMANLQGADLRRANLKGANLRQANLQGDRLEGANLEGAYLWMANLQEANLKGANLQGANLWRANLQGADLLLANLEGATLIRAKDLTQKQLDEACGDAKTKLPPNLSVKRCPKESK